MGERPQGTGSRQQTAQEKKIVMPSYNAAEKEEDYEDWNGI